MKNRTILKWLARAACVLAVIALLYVLTAPPIILVRYHRTNDGRMPSFYDPLMNLAQHDLGTPLKWYFRVWGADFSKLPAGKHGEPPEFRLVTHVS
jgi:hypothetical protein